MRKARGRRLLAVLLVAAPLTETVVVQPGQWIDSTLESDLSRSAIGVS